MPDPLDLVISRIDDLHEDVRTGFAHIGDRLKATEGDIVEIKTKAAEIKGERRASARVYNAISTVIGGAIVAAIDAYFNGGIHHP